MTFTEYIHSIGFTDASFWGLMVFAASIGVEVIPRFKWNPWTSLFTWIGSKINDRIDRNVSEVKKDVEAVRISVESVQGQLDKHVKESEEKALQETRRDILDFCNSVMNGRLHTKEQYDFIIKQCDKYEEHIEKNEIKNGVITSAIKEIRKWYERCIEENTFLKEEEDE